MKRMMMVVGMVVGFAMGCDLGPVDNGLISEGPGPLPGDCNNPVLCNGGGPRPGDNGGGGSGEMCMGCACTARPATCQTCEQRCGHKREICLINRDDACDEIYQGCRQDCGIVEGQTCACPR